MKTEEKSLFHAILDGLEQGILIENTQGGVKYANASWRKALDHEDSLLPLAFRKKALASTSKSFSYLSATGAVCEVLFSPLEEDGYIMWVLRDVDELTQLQEENYVLNEIIEKVDEAIIFTEPNGKITLYNAAHEGLDSTTAGEMLGKKVSDVYQKEMHSQVAKNNNEVKDLFHTYLLKDGYVVNTLSSTFPLWLQGKFLGVCSISRDITFSKNLIRKMVSLQNEVVGHHSSNPNGTRYSIDDIIGESTAMKAVKADAKKMAMSISPLMLYGETGTGKELFAQSIHNEGLCREEPFVAINCAAVPENLLESTLFGTEKGAFTGAAQSIGLMEQAGKGTFFLDEINSMPLMMQSKLLRVLQEKKIRRVGGSKEIAIACRVISSCNQSPEKCAKDGILRMDLFYRLAILRINIPPLRERSGDITLLAKYFSEKIGRAYGKALLNFDDEFFAYLEKNSWPGNVRELEFTIEGCIASVHDTSVLSAKNIPRYLNNDPFSHQDTEVYQENTQAVEKILPQEGTLNNILMVTEKTAVKEALKENNHNISKAARALGIGRQNLQYRMKKLGLK